MKRLALLLALPLAACTMPAEDYVRADRDTFDAVAPVVRLLADGDDTNDPDLTGVNGRAMLLLMDTWEMRLTKAEEVIQ